MDELREIPYEHRPSDYLIAKVCKEIIGDELQATESPKGSFWSTGRYSVKSNSRVKKLILEKVLPEVTDVNGRITSILTMTKSLNDVIEMLHALILV